MSVLENVSQNLVNTKHVSNVLRNSALKRVNFDPTNEDHLKALHQFRSQGRWFIHFNVEEPYQEVPTTVYNKLMNHVLSKFDEGK